MNYMVMLSMPGCLPDSQEVYATLTDARNGAQRWAEIMREDGDYVKGNKKIGYVVYRDKESAYPYYYIEITATEEEPD